MAKSKTKTVKKKPDPNKCKKCKRQKVDGKCTECGRPSKSTPEVVSKLVAAFQRDFNVTEACIHAGITRETYYQWIKNEKEFSDKMADAQRYLNMVAKEQHAQIIADPDVSVKTKSVHIITQLKLRAKDPETGESEYAQQNNVRHSGKIEDGSMTEEEKEIVEKFNNLDDDALEAINRIIDNA